MDECKPLRGGMQERGPRGHRNHARLRRRHNRGGGRAGQFPRGRRRGGAPHAEVRSRRRAPRRLHLLAPKRKLGTLATPRTESDHSGCPPPILSTMRRRGRPSERAHFFVVQLTRISWACVPREQRGGGDRGDLAGDEPIRQGPALELHTTRGLLSSTFRLKVSALCGIGDALGVCKGFVLGCLRGC